MREIKFRAWEENGENMIHPDEVGDHTLNSLTEELPYILMQYTGLRDCNGKRIYEGDIISGSWETVFQVFYCENHLQFRAKSKNTEREIDYYGIDKLEVIGNIHENKDLIK